jgi:hypothetical protein
MLYKAKFAVFPEIRTNHKNSMRSQSKIVWMLNQVVCKFTGRLSKAKVNENNGQITHTLARSQRQNM